MNIKKDGIVFIVCCVIIYLFTRNWIDTGIGVCALAIVFGLKYIYCLHLIEQYYAHREEATIDDEE